MNGAARRSGLHVRVAEFLVLGAILAVIIARLLAPGAPTDRPPPGGFVHLVNLNTAPWHELVNLPGIGAARARDIVKDREEHGPFRSIEDLSRVRGIGPATLAGLSDWVIVE
jgi:competence protein ComEA